MAKAKKYIVQVKQSYGWVQSLNIGANRTFRSLERANKAAKKQETIGVLKYRVHEVK